MEVEGKTNLGDLPQYFKFVQWMLTSSLKRKRILFAITTSFTNNLCLSSREKKASGDEVRMSRRGPVSAETHTHHYGHAKTERTSLSQIERSLTLMISSGTKFSDVLINISITSEPFNLFLLFFNHVSEFLKYASKFNNRWFNVLHCIRAALYVLVLLNNYEKRKKKRITMSQIILYTKPVTIYVVSTQLTGFDRRDSWKINSEPQ